MNSGLRRFIKVCRGFATYILWTWVPTATLLIAGYWLSPQRYLHLAASPLFPLGWNGMFAAGLAVYMGTRLGASGGLKRRRLVLNGAFAVLGVLIAQAVSGLVYCCGVAAYARLYGLHNTKAGADVATLYFTTGWAILLLSLIAGLVSCTLGCTIGTVVGNIPIAGPGDAANEGFAARWPGIVSALCVSGFTILNMVGYYGHWYYMVAGLVLINWTQASGIPLQLQSVLCIMLADNIWVGIAALWFLWSRGSAKLPAWKKWLLFAPLLGLTVLFLLPMLRL